MTCAGQQAPGAAPLSLRHPGQAVHDQRAAGAAVGDRGDQPEERDAAAGADRAERAAEESVPGAGGFDQGGGARQGDPRGGGGPGQGQPPPAREHHADAGAVRNEQAVERADAAGVGQRHADDSDAGRSSETALSSVLPACPRPSTRPTRPPGPAPWAIPPFEALAPPGRLWLRPFTHSRARGSRAGRAVSSRASRTASSGGSRMAPAAWMFGRPGSSARCGRRPGRAGAPAAHAVPHELVDRDPLGHRRGVGGLGDRARRLQLDGRSAPVPGRRRGVPGARPRPFRTAARYSAIPPPCSTTESSTTRQVIGEEPLAPGNSGEHRQQHQQQRAQAARAEQAMMPPVAPVDSRAARAPAAAPPCAPPAPRRANSSVRAVGHLEPGPDEPGAERHEGEQQEHLRRRLAVVEEAVAQLHVEPAAMTSPAANAARKPLPPTASAAA